MSKILLVYNNHSAFIDQIKNSQFDSIQYDELADVNGYDYIFDFTYLPIDQKHALCDKLNQCNKEFHTDLTACSNKEFHEKYSKLMGSFSALLVTNKEKIEFFCQGNKDEVVRVLSDLSLEPEWYDYYGIGFVYPRVLAQIVNEAYFALEENIASKEDIDRAMMYGVNYPNGPFNWSLGKEQIFVELLQQLSSLNPKRYEIAPKLIEVIK